MVFVYQRHCGNLHVYVVDLPIIRLIKPVAQQTAHATDILIDCHLRTKKLSWNVRLTNIKNFHTGNKF